MGFPVGRAGEVFAHEVGTESRNAQGQAAPQPTGLQGGGGAPSHESLLAAFDFDLPADQTTGAGSAETKTAAENGLLAPPSRFPERLGQPGGLASSNVNMRTEVGRAQQMFGTASSVAGAVGAATPALTQAGSVLAPASHGLNLFGSGFNAFASSGKKARYTKQLDASLQGDVGKFRASIAEGKRQDGAGGGVSQAYPRQDTLLLTRDKKGAFQYDMGKVAALAKSDDPALAGASAHAKDILLADHIANQVAGKQRNRALYGAASSALSVAGSGLLAGATHGGSVAASGALQAAGYAVNGAVGMDPAAAARTYKKGMREDKNTKIDHADLLNRVKFAQESHDGFKVAGVDVRNGKGEVVGRVPERTVPVGAVPEAAVKAARGALHDRAVQTVNRKNVFGGLFPGRMIDESKTDAAKGERRGVVAAHAYGIIKGHMGPTTRRGCRGSPARSRPSRTSRATSRRSSRTWSSRTRRWPTRTSCSGTWERPGPRHTGT